MRCSARIGLVIAALTTALWAPANAQGRPPGWHFTGEFTTVWTGGNAEANTFGLNTTLRYRWPRSEFKFEAGAIRTETVRTTRTAIGTGQSDFVIDQDSNREKTAENFFLRSRFDFDVSERFFVFSGADWLRNTFAGLDSRLLFAAGAGNTWVATETMSFKTDYSFTYTFEEDVVENPFAANNFPGLRFAYAYDHEITSTTTLGSALTGDWNLDETDDLRMEFINSLAVAISSRLALKPSLKLQWRNHPALKAVDLVLPDGTDTGTQVLAPLDKLDTFFTIAVVVTF